MTDRDNIALPTLPPEADAQLYLRRDLAIAAIALKLKVPLQTAADQMNNFMAQVDNQLATTLNAMSTRARREAAASHDPGPTVPGPIARPEER